MYEQERTVKDDSAAQDVVMNALSGLIIDKEQHAKRFREQLESALLDGPAIFDTPRGQPKAEIAAVQRELLEFLESNTDPRFQHLKADALFLSFAKKMCIIAARNLPHGEEALAHNQQKMESFVTHLETQYQLLNDTGLGRPFIKTHAHMFSLWTIGATLHDAPRIFGSDTDSEGIVDTAIKQVLAKRYPSVSEAKEAYDTILSEAKQVFGSDPSSSHLVKTAAYNVFTGRYVSITAAKEAYDSVYAEAFRVLGMDGDSEPLIRTATCMVFTDRFKSIEDFKIAYNE